MKCDNEPKTRDNKSIIVYLADIWSNRVEYKPHLIPKNPSEALKIRENRNNA